MLAIWNKVKAILTAPITQDLDPLNLALITGIVMVSFIGWLIVIKYMREAPAIIAGKV